MGMEETAQDVLELVQALAQGKQVERKYRLNSEARWELLANAEGRLEFDPMHYQYRIKTDPLGEWRKELLEHVLEYGKQYGNAEVYYGHNDVRSGDMHSANAAEALNKFKIKLARGPENFR